MSEVKVPDGYKQTEIGVIPEDWEVKDIGEALTIKHGKDQKQVESSSGQYPIFGTGGQMGWANNFLYNKPSVLIGRKGSINKPRYIDVPFWTVDTLFYSQVHNGYDEKFMFYKFCLIDWMNYNEASGVPSLNASTISNVKISVPKKLEQTAIATALSNVDDLIQSLEKLIAKKEAIKTGTMQQLLTGKTRLPEFANHEDGSPKGFKQTELGRIPEDWGFIPMGKLGTTYGGLSGKSKNDFGLGNSYYVPFTNVMANVVINSNNLEKVVVNETQNLVISNDLLFNGSSETPEEVCLCSMVETNIKYLYLNSFCFGFRSNYKNLYLPIFLAYWFRAEIGRKAVFTLAQGSTRYNISKSQFLKLNIVLPSFKEQTAIATILSDMDAEIQALQHRLEKTKDIKQGMMQQLLTGKVRLAH